jgi:hypothetical protein
MDAIGGPSVTSNVPLSGAKSSRIIFSAGLDVRQPMGENGCSRHTLLGFSQAPEHQGLLLLACAGQSA